MLGSASNRELAGSTGARHQLFRYVPLEAVVVTKNRLTRTLCFRR